MIERIGPDTATRTAWLLHGILGSGRNWRSFARRLSEAHPEWQFWMPDLRGHGGAPPRPPPHTVEAVARDLWDLPTPEVVIGHSFGGKVALTWARVAPVPPREVVVLDAPPGRSPPSDRTHEALAVLRAVRDAPCPAASREDLRDHLRRAGLPESIVAWLLTSTRRQSDPEGWTWVYDIDAVQDMIEDYFALDLWPLLAPGALPTRVRFVRAGRSDRWTEAELARFDVAPHLALETIPNAGHWVHVDAPDALRALLARSLSSLPAWSSG